MLWSGLLTGPHCRPKVSTYHSNVLWSLNLETCGRKRWQGLLARADGLLQDVSVEQVAHSAAGGQLQMQRHGATGTPEVVGR